MACRWRNSTGKCSEVKRQRCVWGIANILVYLVLKVCGGIRDRNGKGGCDYSRTGFDSQAGKFPLNSVGTRELRGCGTRRINLPSGQGMQCVWERQEEGRPLEGLITVWVDVIGALTEAVDSEEGQAGGVWGRRQRKSPQFLITGQILRNDDQGGGLGEWPDGAAVHSKRNFGRKNSFGDWEKGDKFILRHFELEVLGRGRVGVLERRDIQMEGIGSRQFGAVRKEWEDGEEGHVAQALYSWNFSHWDFWHCL